MFPIASGFLEIEHGIFDPFLQYGDVLATTVELHSSSIKIGWSIKGTCLLYRPIFKMSIFFLNVHILIKYLSYNLFDHSKSIRKCQRIQKYYQLISMTKYYCGFWRVNISDFFDFFIPFFTIKPLTLLCSVIYIYFLLQKWERGDPGLSYEWSKKFISRKFEKLSKFEVDRYYTKILTSTFFQDLK